jgi:tetratricopeptide (TPR) repeat protein
LPAIHISRTEGTFTATGRAIDPADGRELAIVTVHGHAQKQNESQTSVPEYPAPADLKSMALHQGLTEAQRLYTPWFENREIPFPDSRECNLKQAYDAAKSGDYEALLRLSESDAAACGTGSKVAMEAYYDLGVSYMLLGRYDEASAAFEKSTNLNGGKLVGGLLEECRQESAAVKARQPKPALAGETERSQTGIV